MFVYSPSRDNLSNSAIPEAIEKDQIATITNVKDWLITSSQEHLFSAESLDVEISDTQEKKFNEIKSRVESLTTSVFGQVEREGIDGYSLIWRNKTDKTVSKGCVISITENQSSDKYIELSNRLADLDSETEYYFNSDNLIERKTFGIVLRIDSRPPQEILENGFGNGSIQFDGGPSLLGKNSCLICSRTYQGNVEFSKQVEGNWYMYGINAENIPGVSLLENVQYNHENLSKFLGYKIDQDVKPLDLYEGVGCFDELHLSSDFLFDRIFFYTD
ncbi:MAG: hypothetical protein ACRCSV_00565 [Chlamydiales bacterium]